MSVWPQQLVFEVRIKLRTNTSGKEPSTTNTYSKKEGEEEDEREYRELETKMKERWRIAANPNILKVTGRHYPGYKERDQ